MELPISTSFEVLSKASLCSFSSKQVLYVSSLRCRKIGLRWSRCSKFFVGITMSSEKESLSNGYGGGQNEAAANCGFIDVIGIGSRKDAVLDFCLKSPFQLSSIRFWNILMKESQEVQLQLRSTDKEFLPRTVGAMMFKKSCSKAIVLVASAGYGLDDTVAVDIFKAMKSSGGLTVAIVLKPFTFEGLRRRDEVKGLVEKLKDNTDLLIEIDIDALLKKDLVTLDEAVKTANDAVLLAINAMSVIRSETHRKLIDRLHSGLTEVSIYDINKIFESYKEARIGFGAAYNLKTSILQSLFDCPFLGVSLKDPNSIVICSVASSVPINDTDVVAFLHTFRQITKYTKEIIISTNHEPNLEPNLLVTTVLTLGNTDMQQSSKGGGMLSRLAQHFPLLFNFWGRRQHQPVDTWKENATESLSPEVNELNNFNEDADRVSPDVMHDTFSKYFESLELPDNSKIINLNGSRISEQNREELFDTSSDYSTLYNEITGGGDFAYQRERLANWNLGPGHELAQERAKERAADANSVTDNISIFHLPVGVRSSEELKDCLEPSIAQQGPATETDVGLEAVMEFTSALFKGKYTDKPNKQGVLSHRAASMLEKERDSSKSKRWIPIVEMEYRGGRYKGRCQGGLPEGKGQLVLGDGSIYDGLWRYGKRSGLGTLYFINGDVFQGSWRDDLMHGKSWIYFHTGDRWFANFWKGKANGEGRFYTKNGDVFFGNFKDGWRHGQFLCINANGTRYIEMWEQGVLLGSKHLDEDAGAG